MTLLLLHLTTSSFAAVSDFALASDTNVSSCSNHMRLEELYVAAGDRENAIRELKCVAALSNSQDPNTEAMVCMAYIKLHEIPLAIRHCSNFLTSAARLRVASESRAQFDNLLAEMQASLVPTFFTNSQPQHYDKAALHSVLLKKLGQCAKAFDIDPLYASPAMTNWALALTREATNDIQRSKALFEALTRHLDGLASVPHTAEQVFTEWNSVGASFHCQDYTYLYISLSRAVGLNTYFVSVSKPFNNRNELHACAGIFLGDKLLLVDPMYCRFGAAHRDFLVLDDVQALAVYLSQLKDIRDCQTAYKLSPDLLPVLANYITALAREGNWHEARNRMRKLLQLNQDSWISFYIQGFLRLHEGDPESALDLLSKAVALNPDSYAVWWTMGTAYKEKGDLELAKNSYSHAMHCIASPQELASAQQWVSSIEIMVGGGRRN